MRKNTAYFYTGVAATEHEEYEMKRPLPFMVIGGSVTPSSAETIHRYAIGHGLPEIKGYYGYDFDGHEFIRLRTAFDEPADAFPSRRLRDILRKAEA